MLYKRTNSPYWYVKLERDGEILRESTGTENRSLAKVYEAKRIAELYKSKSLGIEDHTLRELVDRWKREKASKRSLGRDLEILSRIPKQEALLADIDGKWLQGYLSSLAAGSSPANANRHRACIVSALNQAKSWGWIDAVPTLETYSTVKHEPRWLTREQFEQLARELPPHVEAMARFGVATGLRYSNIAGFRWDWIRERVAYVPPAEAKAGKPIAVPLNAAAMAVLDRQKGLDATWAFVDHKGSGPVGSVKTAWLKAVKRAGLEGVRFHDLRHSWASWHLAAGTPLMVLQRLGGWSSLKMISEVYGHFATDELSRYADRV